MQLPCLVTCLLTDESMLRSYVTITFRCCRVNTAENYFFVSVYFISQPPAKFAFVFKISTFQDNHLHSKVTCTTWKTICQKFDK